jgi:uncharacterized protein
MQRRRPAFRLTHLACTAGAAAILVAASMPVAEAQDRQVIRWQTSSTASYGYMVASAMVSILEEALEGEYTVVVNPHPSTTGAMKAAMDGDGEIGYTADVGMQELYEGGGPFEGYDATAGMLVHTWYAYPMESFMAVPAASAGEFECLRDFDGEPVFYTTAGFMNWLNWRRIFDALGYEMNHVEIDPATNADALDGGTIVGSASYTTAGRSLAAYWRETELRAEVTLVSPCADEVEQLQQAGLSVAEVDPSIAFSQDVGVESVLGVPILFAYNARADLPEDVVYRMLNAFYEQRESLAESDPGFTPMAQDFVGMQVSGISANPDIPVHPGLARFLQEHDAWNDEWTIADGA